MKLNDVNQDNVANLKRSITDKLIYTVGKDPASAQPKDWLQATALAVRDRLVDRA
jgi:starch phosphorylase